DQLRMAERAGVLVLPRIERPLGRLVDLARPLEVGEALREVDRAVVERELGHLAEDRGAERLQLVGDHGTTLPLLRSIATSPPAGTTIRSGARPAAVSSSSRSASVRFHRRILLGKTVARTPSSWPRATVPFSASRTTFEWRSTWSSSNAR